MSARLPAILLLSLVLAGCGAPVSHKSLHFRVLDERTPGTFLVDAGAFRTDKGNPCSVGVSLKVGQVGNATCEGTSWPKTLRVLAQFMDASWKPGMKSTSNASGVIVPTSDRWQAQIILRPDGNFTLDSTPDP